MRGGGGQGEEEVSMKVTVGVEVGAAEVGGGNGRGEGRDWTITAGVESAIRDCEWNREWWRRAILSPLGAKKKFRRQLRDHYGNVFFGQKRL